jgi:hypothetical protein
MGSGKGEAMERYTEPTRWGREIEETLRFHRANASAFLWDLARAAAREFTEGWEAEDWRAARRGLNARQREMLRTLADQLAEEWTTSWDTPADTRSYARELRVTIPGAVRALARRWRLAPREWPPRLLEAS